MSQRLQMRRGTAAELAAITPASGEPCWTTDTKLLYVGDGATAGGVAAGGGGSGSGTKTLERWRAVQNEAPASSAATFDTRNSIPVYEFDAASAESAVFSGIIPEGADLSVGITVIISWVADTATSGNVIWTGAFERGTTDLDTDSFATGIDSSAAAANGTSGIVTQTSINFSSSEIDGLSVGDLFRLKITRKAADASDTMTGDAQLIAVEARQR